MDDVNVRVGNLDHHQLTRFIEVLPKPNTRRHYLPT
jgi:hypothetical protein